ncbi:MAG: hypothetical protein JF612_10515, partial [Planctomycetia bacterium]|nr:hypothetical protein [Planctomycetia bacterium]
MPSTTNISIGTIFELVGPAAPSAAIDGDQPAFNSLLQSQPASPPASPAPQAAPDSRTADENRTPAYRTENSAERQDSSPPQSSADGGSRDSTNDAPATSQQNSRSKTTAAAPEEKSSKPGSDSSRDDLPASDQKPTAQSVVAESLAGLAAIAPVATSRAPPAVVTGAKEPKETEPTETKAASAKQVPPSRAGTAQPAPIKSPVGDIDNKASQETAAPQTKAGIPDTSQVATAIPNTVPAAATAPNTIQAAVPQQNTIEANTAAPESTIQAADPPQGAP